MATRSRTLFLLLLLGAAAGRPQGAKDTLAKVHFEISKQNWEQAAQLLANVEKAGGCQPAVCLATHARISDGAGAGPQAVDYARQALAAGQDSGLDATHYNELGAVLYRRAEGKKELLQLAEKALRKADSTYSGGASNIRYNLAKVLQKLGRNDEAKEIMKKLEADGILINPGMAVLGDFKRPVAPSKPYFPPNR
jgi:tetratricopeptide (TPR) repeat protein